MAIHTLQVTLSGSAQPLTTTNTLARWVNVQNNAAAAMRLGDSSVTASKGLNLAASGGIITIALDDRQSPLDLSQIYIIGTAAQLADVTYCD